MLPRAHRYGETLSPAQLRCHTGESSCAQQDAVAPPSQLWRAADHSRGAPYGDRNPASEVMNASPPSCRQRRVPVAAAGRPEYSPAPRCADVRDSLDVAGMCAPRCCFTPPMRTSAEACALNDDADVLLGATAALESSLTRQIRSIARTFDLNAEDAPPVWSEGSDVSTRMGLQSQAGAADVCAGYLGNSPLSHADLQRDAAAMLQSMPAVVPGFRGQEAGAGGEGGRVTVLAGLPDSAWRDEGKMMYDTQQSWSGVQWQGGCARYGDTCGLEGEDSLADSANLLDLQATTGFTIITEHMANNENLGDTLHARASTASIVLGQANECSTSERYSDSCRSNASSVES